MRKLTRIGLTVLCLLIVITTVAQAESGITIDQLLAGETVIGKVLTDHDPAEKIGYDLVDLSDESNDHGIMDMLQERVFIPVAQAQELTAPLLTIGLWLESPLPEDGESWDDIEQQIVTIDMFEGTDYLLITSPADPTLDGQYVTDETFYVYIDDLHASLRALFADMDWNEYEEWPPDEIDMLVDDLVDDN